MKLEVGKFYRTRDGRKAQFLRHDTPVLGYVRIEGMSYDHNIYTDTKDAGRSMRGKDMRDDLVAEWTDDAPAAKEESELERLVRVANEGTTAVAELKAKHPFDVQVSAGDDYWIGVGVSGPRIRYRVKPRPAFEPFYVNNGQWKVSLSDDGHSQNAQPTVRGVAEQSVAGKTLSVGCQTFPASQVLAAHRALKGATTYRGVGGFDLYAYRDGVGRTDRTGPELTWTDFDRIGAALEKALGGKP
jgi:hypothetical protein